jgi:hypothetical protein
MQHLERFFICLKSSDLYCYENDTKKKVKFMHSLIGCFPVELETPPPPLPRVDSESLLNILPIMDYNAMQQGLPLPYEEIDGVKYWRIEIKLSQIYKRVFFLKNIEERDLWHKRLVKAAKIRSLNEDFEI